ncbi:hypothetical protein KR018_002543 [Drosophila ironensis]|nr:hypothetical protein KR018_002543 [Drosophila ironensis]
MASTRFFVADLPARTSEEDLRGVFGDYGRVEHVDLKRKEQDDGPAKVIAFVTLRTEDAHYCVSELNWQQLHGHNLRVSLAKESFLDRLKREREEQQSQEQPSGHEFTPSSSQLLSQSGQNKRRVFGEDEEIGDDEIAPELLITKKRAAHSMHNGRIVIQQEEGAKPLHVIEKHRKPGKQQADGRDSQAEQKRKESLLKMRQEHLQKKSAIQQALSGIATADGPQAKRIKFSDPDEEKPTPAKKKALFDDEDEEEASEEIVLPQHKGKKGERLVEMQSKQSLDPRFRITSNFVADEDEEEEDEGEEGEEQAPAQESERNWQMGILEQVVGHKLTSASDSSGNPAKTKKMLRFDPAKEGHQKLMRQKQPPKEEPEASPTEDKDSKISRTTKSSAPNAVSKSSFYVVTDTLKESLKMRGEGFSLLDMFGSAPDEEEARRQDQLEKLGTEKILVGKLSANKLGLDTVNPFSYDSSDSEDADEGPPRGEEEPPKISDENVCPPAKKAKQKKPKIKMESFFIPKNDPRLKEGAKFFKSAKPTVNQADYEQVKNRLKLLITNKIAKTKKNLPQKDIQQLRIKQRTKNTRPG